MSEDKFNKALAIILVCIFFGAIVISISNRINRLESKQKDIINRLERLEKE